MSDKAKRNFIKTKDRSEVYLWIKDHKEEVENEEDADLIPRCRTDLGPNVVFNDGHFARIRMDHGIKRLHKAKPAPEKMVPVSQLEALEAKLFKLESHHLNQVAGLSILAKALHELLTHSTLTDMRRQILGAQIKTVIDGNFDHLKKMA